MKRITDLTIKIRRTGQRIEIQDADPGTTVEELLVALSQELNSPGIENAMLFRKSVSSCLKPEQTLKSAEIEDKETLEVRFTRPRNYKRYLLYPVVMVCGVVAVSALIGIFWQDPEAKVTILRVVVAAAIGSLLGTCNWLCSPKQVQVDDQIWWVLTLLLRGILMGIFVSFAILSGLIIIGLSAGASFDPSNISPFLLCSVAFLGGFSEEFFRKVISSFIERLSIGQGEASSSQGTDTSSKT
jgi:hypothetical protein